MASALVFRKFTRPTPLENNIFLVDTGNTHVLGQDPSAVITPILTNTVNSREHSPITIDYPFDKSVFPPEIIAPTFLWHDSREKSDLWLIDIRFEGNSYHIYALTAGKQTEPEIDPEAVSSANEHYKRSDYDIAAKAWTPDEQTWQVVKQNSVKQNAIVTVYGLDSRNNNQVLSMAHINLTTSSDPVGAPVFYRDVPLMPSETKGGEIKPIAEDALPLIAWRLRDISKPSAPAVLKEMPTCANCHSFSKNGKVLGMDMDGPNGDKGAYGLTKITKEIVIKNDDIITWNSYKYSPKGHKNFGLFSQVSPNGRYVISTLNESTFVINYPHFEFLQSFYPTRGILVVYDRETGQMKPLPGADNTYYVQTNACWSPDGKQLVFSRATAKDNYESMEKPEYAGDNRETFIQYDLYSIPFNDGKGGTAKPLRGASANGMSNSFPKFSPDGKWIVFVKSKKGQLMRPDSKLYIVPSQGGEERKMKCNLDPMNSWHSWSPNGRWLVFSSKGFRPFTQIFLTHIDKEGNDTPAILIPNSTAANRAVNIPEFLNGSGDAIASISAPTQESYRHFNAANELGKEGNLSEALAELEKSIEINPYYDKAYSDKGFILFKLGRNEEAIACLKKALELDPKNEKAHNNLGLVLETEGRIDEAIAYYTQVLEKDPALITTRCCLANLYKTQGEFQKAINHYRLALEANPYSTNIHYDLGNIFLLQKNYDEAVKYYKKTLELDDRYTNAYFSLGQIYQLQGKIDEAVACFQKTAELDDKDVEAYYSLAALLHRQGKVDDASRQYLKILEIEPNHIDARKKLALIYFEQKKIRLSMEQFETILNLQPQDIIALNGLAWILSVSEDSTIADPERAVKLALKACELTRNNAPTLLDTLAVSCAAAGNYKQAVEQAEKAFQLANLADDKALAGKIRKHLELFKNHRPYYEPASQR
jgi:tetratricopeptide (TPR) repeat protein